MVSGLSTSNDKVCDRNLHQTLTFAQGHEPETFTRNFANWAEAVAGRHGAGPLAICGSIAPAADRGPNLNPDLNLACRSEDAEEVGPHGLRPASAADSNDNGLGLAAGPFHSTGWLAVGGDPATWEQANPNPDRSPGRSAPTGAELPAIVAELTTALAAAPAARVAAVGPELPGALRDLARALLAEQDDQGSAGADLEPYQGAMGLAASGALLAAVGPAGANAVGSQAGFHASVSPTEPTPAPGIASAAAPALSPVCDAGMCCPDEAKSALSSLADADSPGGLPGGGTGPEDCPGETELVLCSPAAAASGGLVGHGVSGVPPCVASPRACSPAAPAGLAGLREGGRSASPSGDAATKPGSPAAATATGLTCSGAGPASLAGQTAAALSAPAAADPASRGADNASCPGGASLAQGRPAAGTAPAQVTSEAAGSVAAPGEAASAAQAAPGAGRADPVAGPGDTGAAAAAAEGSGLSAAGEHASAARAAVRPDAALEALPGSEAGILAQPGEMAASAAAAEACVLDAAGGHASTGRAAVQGAAAAYPPAQAVLPTAARMQLRASPYCRDRQTGAAVLGDSSADASAAAPLQHPRAEAGALAAPGTLGGSTGSELGSGIGLLAPARRSPPVVPRLDLSRCADGRRLSSSAGSDVFNLAPLADPIPKAAPVALPAARSTGRARRNGPFRGEERAGAASLLRRALFPSRSVAPAADARSVGTGPRPLPQPLAASQRAPDVMAEATTGPVEGPSNGSGGLPQYAGAGQGGAGAPVSVQPDVLPTEPSAPPRSSRLNPRSWWRGLMGGRSRAPTLNLTPEPWVDEAGVRWRRNVSAAGAGSARGRSAPALAAPALRVSADLQQPGSQHVQHDSQGAKAVSLAPSLLSGGAGCAAPGAAQGAALGELPAVAEGGGAGDGGSLDPSVEPKPRLDAGPPRAPLDPMSPEPDGVVWRDNAAADDAPDGGGNCNPTERLVALRLDDLGGGAAAAPPAPRQSAACEGAPAALLECVAVAGAAVKAAGASHGAPGAPDGASCEDDGVRGELGRLPSVSDAPELHDALEGAELPDAGGSRCGRSLLPSGGGVGNPNSTLHPADLPDAGSACSRRSRLSSRSEAGSPTHTLPVLMDTGDASVGCGRLSSAGEAFLAAMYTGVHTHPLPAGRLNRYRTRSPASRSASPGVPASRSNSVSPNRSAQALNGRSKGHLETGESDNVGSPFDAAKSAGREGLDTSATLPYPGSCRHSGRLESLGGPGAQPGAGCLSQCLTEASGMGSKGGMHGSCAALIASSTELPSVSSTVDGPWAAKWVGAPPRSPGATGPPLTPPPEAVQEGMHAGENVGLLISAAAWAGGAVAEAGTQEGKGAGAGGVQSPLATTVSIVASSCSVPEAPVAANPADPYPNPNAEPGAASSPDGAGAAGAQRAQTPRRAHAAWQASDPKPDPASCAARSIGRPPRSPERPPRRASMPCDPAVSSDAVSASMMAAPEAAQAAGVQGSCATLAMGLPGIGAAPVSKGAAGEGSGLLACEEGTRADLAMDPTPVRARVRQLNAQVRGAASPRVGTLSPHAPQLCSGDGGAPGGPATPGLHESPERGRERHAPGGDMIGEPPGVEGVVQGGGSQAQAGPVADAALAVAARAGGPAGAGSAGVLTLGADSTVSAPEGPLQAQSGELPWREPGLSQPLLRLLSRRASPDASDPSSGPGRPGSRSDSCLSPLPVPAPGQSLTRNPAQNPNPMMSGGPFACRVHPSVAAAAVAAGALPMRRATAAGADGAHVGRLVAVVPYATLRGAPCALPHQNTGWRGMNTWLRWCPLCQTSMLRYAHNFAPFCATSPC